jgi:uncharacterized damage-inducible protein DinB
MPQTSENIRNILADMLSEEHAHAGIEDAVKNFPFKKAGKKIRNIPYTVWQLLEHIRLTQFDILDFIQNPDYKEKNWPDDYWPDEKAPSSEKVWKDSLKQIRKDKKMLLDIVKNPKIILDKPLRAGYPQTLLREVILVIDHSSYHTGQIILLRRALNEWK